MERRIEMRFERSTKGTYVFTEDVENSGCRTLYLTKGVFGGVAPPEQILMVVTWYIKTDKEPNDGTMC